LDMYVFIGWLLTFDDVKEGIIEKKQGVVLD
jgi:hypothetical protein